MLGYDGRHAGENPVETGKPPLDLSWSVKPASGVVSAPVIDEGRVYLTAADLTSKKLFSLRLSDGSGQWSYALGSSSVGWPTTAAGRVFVSAMSGFSLKLWSLDGSTGAGLWATEMSSGFGLPANPSVVTPSTVYAVGGKEVGLYRLDAVSGIQQYFAHLGQFGPGPLGSGGVALANDILFTYVSGAFRATEAPSGLTLWSFQLGGWPIGLSQSVTPTVAGKFVYFVAKPDLVAVDIGLKAPIWSKPGYDGHVTVAGGAVYGLSGGNLIVRHAATGASLWVFAGDGALKYTPVIAAGFVYVASDKNVYAVSTTTHKQVWSTGFGGHMAIASGRLVIVGEDGTVRGYLFKG